MFGELFLEHRRAAQRVLGAGFCTLKGGTACFGSCFWDILGRHSVFWDLRFEHFRAAQRGFGAVFEDVRVAGVGLG